MEQIIEEGTILMDVAHLEEDLAQLADRQKLLKENIYETFVDFLQTGDAEVSSESHQTEHATEGHKYAQLGS